MANIPNEYIVANNKVHWSIMRSLMEAEYDLNHKILDFRHSLNDQVILLKYGENADRSKIRHDDPILIHHER